MRAAVVAVSLIASAARAGSASLPHVRMNDQPAAFPQARMNDLPGAVSAREPLAFSGQIHFAPRHRADLPLLGPQPTLPPSPGFSIGPLHAEGFSREVGKNGRVRFKPHYRLEGVSVLGGSIGGSVSTRGGMLTLNWHTGG
jgi:hypothetical protein